ncbi:hypothetical protein [Pseudomonas indica]|uniref:hypothetical protein n=1 Tax=Pseudomonas indica TaxID=137658 RepID=UPI003FD17529
MANYRPLSPFSSSGDPVLFVDTDQNEQNLFEAAQERLDAARQLALVLLCSDQQLDNGQVFSAFYLLLNDAAGLHEAAFQRQKRRRPQAIPIQS